MLEDSSILLPWPVAISGAVVSVLLFSIPLAAKRWLNTTEKWPDTAEERSKALKEHRKHRRIEVGISVLALLSCGVFLRLAPGELGEYFHSVGEALMVVALIGTVLEVPHIREFFQEGLRNALTPRIDLDGEWVYEVINKKMGLRNKGTCTITTLGHDVEISGCRTDYIPKGKTTLVRLGENKIPWRTEFGYIGGVIPPKLYFPKLHFVYEITVDSETFWGYCTIPLPLSKKPFNKMEGDLFQLAPGIEHGRIRFTKLGTSSQFGQPPSSSRDHRSS